MFCDWAGLFTSIEFDSLNFEKIGILSLVLKDESFCVFCMKQLVYSLFETALVLLIAFLFSSF